MFDNICVIGCGLIGSSIVRAIEKKKLTKKISVFDKSKEVLSYMKNNCTVNTTNDVSEVIKEADLVIIAAPLSSYKEILLSIKNNLKEGAILTDTGSAKKEVNKIIVNLNLKNIHWIASHPIAGTELSGPEAGSADLFNNRWCIITPSKKATDKDINLLKLFWERIGSKVDVMEVKQHDYILSITSHIPHLIAYNIVNTSMNLQDEKKLNIIKYSAGGLRDFTRIAASDPIMWRDIFIQNKKNTSKIITKFIKNLEDLKKAIENEDGKKLEEIFTKTKKIRKDIIEAGQDVKKPDFGRK